VNYKAHYILSWFRPLLEGNSPTSNGSILKMNNGYIGGEQSTREVCKVKGEMFLSIFGLPSTKRVGGLYRP
jgi:hypothetical protein